MVGCIIKEGEIGMLMKFLLMALKTRDGQGENELTADGIWAIYNKHTRAPLIGVITTDNRAVETGFLICLYITF